jgi:hypothetical protein
VLSAGWVEAGEVVAAGIAVAGVGDGDVPDRDEQHALNGDVGFERATVGGDSAIFGGQVGVVGVGDRHRCGAEGTMQVGVARSGAAGFDLAGRFVVSRGGACPRREVLCGGNLVMSAPVSATMMSAVCPPIPGMVQIRSRKLRKGSITASIRSVSCSTSIWAAPRFPDCGFRVHLRCEL